MNAVGKTLARGIFFTKFNSFKRYRQTDNQYSTVTFFAGCGVSFSGVTGLDVTGLGVTGLGVRLLSNSILTTQVFTSRICCLVVAGESVSSISTVSRPAVVSCRVVLCCVVGREHLEVVDSQSLSGGVQRRSANRISDRPTAQQTHHLNRVCACERQRELTHLREATTL